MFPPMIKIVGFHNAKSMKGICKTDNALYVGRFLDGTTVRIGLNRQQRWHFETTSDGRVKLTFRNISIFVSETQFFKDWKIVLAQIN